MPTTGQHLLVTIKHPNIQYITVAVLEFKSINIYICCYKTGIPV